MRGDLRWGSTGTAHERVADETAEHEVDELHGAVSEYSYGVSGNSVNGDVMTAGLIVIDGMTCTKPTGIVVVEWRQQRPLVSRLQSSQADGMSGIIGVSAFVVWSLRTGTSLSHPTAPATRPDIRGWTASIPSR